MLKIFAPSVRLLLLILILCNSNLAAQRTSHYHSSYGKHYHSKSSYSSSKHYTTKKTYSYSHSSGTRHNSYSHTHNRLSRSSFKSTPSTYHSSSSHRSNYASGTTRDSHGRIKRSSKARHDFMKKTGYPHGRKGYVIDHIVPLSKGGCDCPSNMQWQTVEEAKRKDKTERK